jgi:hypothetical protein
MLSASFFTEFLPHSTKAPTSIVALFLLLFLFLFFFSLLFLFPFWTNTETGLRKFKIVVQQNKYTFNTLKVK